MSSMEKAVSHAMTAALTLPTFDVTFNIKPEKLIAAAKARKVSVTVAIAKACSVAMLKHPMLNNCYQPVDKIVERSNHDFGVAVAADGGGLVVPILHNIEQKSLEQLQAEWSELMPRDPRPQAVAQRIRQPDLHHLQHGHVRRHPLHRHPHARHRRHHGHLSYRAGRHAGEHHRRSSRGKRRARRRLPG